MTSHRLKESAAPSPLKKFARVRLAILSASLQLMKERSLTDILVREICDAGTGGTGDLLQRLPQ